MKCPWYRWLRQGFAAGLVLIYLLGSGSLHATTSTRPVSPGGVCPTQTTPSPVPITLMVTLQRPNAPPPDPSWAVPVDFTLYPPGDPDTICHYWALTLDQTGQWSGYLDLFTGTYDARIRNLHTLRNVKRDLTISGPATIHMGTLHEGDANADNFVDILDFARLRRSYFLEEGEPGFDPTADFDESNFIDILDFGLLRGSYFMEGDIEVTALATGVGLAAAAPVTLTLVPSTRELELNEVAEFIIQVDATMQPLQGMDVELYYQPTTVAVVDAAGAPASSIIPGTAFTTLLQNRVDTARSRILFSAGNFGDPSQGVLDVARFYLRGVSPGSAGMWFGPRSTAMDSSYAKVPLALAELTINVKGAFNYRYYLPLSMRN